MANRFTAYAAGLLTSAASFVGIGVPTADAQAQSQPTPQVVPQVNNVTPAFSEFIIFKDISANKGKKINPAFFTGLKLEALVMDYYSGLAGDSAQQAGRDQARQNTMDSLAVLAGFHAFESNGTAAVYCTAEAPTGNIVGLATIKNPNVQTDPVQVRNAVNNYSAAVGNVLNFVSTIEHNGSADQRKALEDALKQVGVYTPSRQKEYLPSPGAQFQLDNVARDGVTVDSFKDILQKQERLAKGLVRDLDRQLDRSGHGNGTPQVIVVNPGASPAVAPAPAQAPASIAINSPQDLSSAVAQLQQTQNDYLVFLDAFKGDVKTDDDPKPLNVGKRLKLYEDERLAELRANPASKRISDEDLRAAVNDEKMEFAAVDIADYLSQHAVGLTDAQKTALNNLRANAALLQGGSHSYNARLEDAVGERIEIESKRATDATIGAIEGWNNYVAQQDSGKPNYNAPRVQTNFAPAAAAPASVPASVPAATPQAEDINLKQPPAPAVVMAAALASIDVERDKLYNFLVTNKDKFQDEIRTAYDNGSMDANKDGKRDKQEHTNFFLKFVRDNPKDARVADMLPVVQNIDNATTAYNKAKAENTALLQRAGNSGNGK